MKQKLKEAKEEISNWRGKYENLEKEKEDDYNEMLEEVTNKFVNEQKKVKELEKENEQLVKYIEQLENESLGNPPRGAALLTFGLFIAYFSHVYMYGLFTCIPY